MNRRVAGLLPWSIYTHYTLFNSPCWAFHWGRVPRTVPCRKRTELRPPVLSLVSVAVAVTRGGAGRCPGGGGERSWRSRSWNSTRLHRAGPAGSAHSWQGGAGPRTLCSGPQRDSQQLQPSKGWTSCKFIFRLLFPPKRHSRFLLPPPHQF